MPNTTDELRFALPNCDACADCERKITVTGFEHRYPYCKIYTREDGVKKPRSVMWNGAPCDYHRKEK